MNPEGIDHPTLVVGQSSALFKSYPRKLTGLCHPHPWDYERLSKPLVTSSVFTDLGYLLAQ